nr:PREDICTED: glypican-5-like [Balearica regulorum gibbericeps]
MNLVIRFPHSALRRADEQFESCPEMPNVREEVVGKGTSEMDVSTKYLAVSYQPNGASGQKPDPQLVQISLVLWKSMLPSRFSTTANLHPSSKEAFESLLRFAENRTSSLFETAYRPMAKEAAEPVKELFTDISLYILGAETTVESAVLRFFDSLFPLVYSRLINPGITDLSEDYTECLRLTRQDINPFGRYSKNMVTELSKSLWASRMLSQALSLGIEVINTTEHAALTKECSKALVKMQYCPHCQGLTLIRPCVGYCLNVMRGCLASVSELDAQWREYISTLEYLTNEMAASHDLEIALTGIRNSINEAILHAQLNGPQLSATVDKVCGQPKQQEGNLSSDNIVPVKEATETQAFVMAHVSLNHKRSSLPLKASKNDKSRSLKKISREFINYMKRSRTFYASIAERLCDGDLVMRDSSTCWNGEDVVESVSEYYLNTTSVEEIAEVDSVNHYAVPGPDTIHLRTLEGLKG